MKPKRIKAGGYKTLLARKKAYRYVLALRGKVHWEGDPDAMRRTKRR